jgi:hypothetical protein
VVTPVTYLFGEAYNGLVGWRILLLALDEEDRRRRGQHY